MPQFLQDIVFLVIVIIGFVTLVRALGNAAAWHEGRRQRKGSRMPDGG